MLLGCLFGRQDNRCHTLTVCSSGAKGAESREQKDRTSPLLQLCRCRKPRLSETGMSEAPPHLDCPESCLEWVTAPGDAC